MPANVVAESVCYGYQIEMVATIVHVLSLRKTSDAGDFEKHFLSSQALTTVAHGLMAVSRLIDEYVEKKKKS